MKSFRFLVAIGFVLLCGACHNGAPADNAGAAKTDTAAAASQNVNGVLASLKNLHFDYNKDPSCGMPLRSGLEDTTTYKGKLYGFCSKECKDAFLADPAGYTAKLK
jgi:YHS domain-containing protein